jgi:hypothetical protein
VGQAELSARRTPLLSHGDIDGDMSYVLPYRLPSIIIALTDRERRKSSAHGYIKAGDKRLGARGF